ncbi:MAG TPA: amidohydrolase [Vicinamibacteria bacterium]|nr:amidohydrolase [Vicinamibacteria bacterium]
MPRTVAVVGLVAALAGAAGEQQPEPRADLIYVNGRIWTGDPARPTAQAIAVRGTRILAVGSDQEIRRHSGVGTGVTDLKGRFVFPGFIDSHLHFLVPEQLDLSALDRAEDIQKAIAEWARTHPDSPWVVGRGWQAGAFPRGGPGRAFLDAVVPDRPAFLNDRDGHTALVNGKALEIASVTRATVDPPGGIVVKDAKGEPTGLLKEAAMELVGAFVPPPNPEELYRALKLRLDQAASYGITSATNASFPEEELRVYERVLDEGGLKVRFRIAVPFVKNASEEDFERWQALRLKHTGERLRFGAAKGMLDGVVDMKTASMFEPYAGGGNGLPLWTQDEVNRAAAAYDERGWQVMLHAIGDRAIHMALDAFEFVEKANGPRDRRFRVEHVEVPRLTDLPRFKQLGAIASTQALFANPDKTTLENYAVLLGPERASRANAFKLFDAAGARQAFGSDWPVFSMEVLRGLYCAVTRQTPEGTPAGGWYPEHRLSVEAALRHFTIDGAYASFEENDKGTLSADKLADFVVLSENILEPPAERLLRSKVLLTVVGGQETWRAPGFPRDPKTDR